MEIKRDAYLQQLTLRKDNGMIKVITGIRRCGKSFLLFTIFKRYLLENGVDVDHIIEIALDGIENEELRDPKVCFKYIKDVMKDDGKYYLLLDEVQFMPQFEEVWNSKDEFNEYVSNLEQRKLYDTGEKIKKKDNLLTLSTCEKASDNSRMVVVCKKSKINDR
jgi:predicted AAA+ superfamily ATPase